MVRCIRCGADIQENTRFCSHCGQAQEVVNTYPEPGYRQNRGSGTGGGYRAGSANSSGFDPADIEDNRVISILCYFALLLLIPLLTRPYSQYVKFHANQGILLLIVMIASRILDFIPIVGWLISWALNIFCVICIILGVINALGGQAKPLPVIGSYSVLR